MTIDIEAYANTNGVGRNVIEARLREALTEIARLRVSDREREDLCERLNVSLGDYADPGEHYADGAARLRRDHDRMLANLTATQARCTSLLDEARANRRIANAPPGELHALGHLSHERRLQDARFGTPTDLLHVPLSAGIANPHGTLIGIRGDAARHCAETGRDTCCWGHVLLEEAFEVVAEEGDPKAMRQELVQLGAVCVRVIEAIDLRAAVAK